MHIHLDGSVFTADLPWLSVVSVSSVCGAIAHRSSVQDRIVYSRGKRQTFVLWYAGDKALVKVRSPMIPCWDLTMFMDDFSHCVCKILKASNVISPRLCVEPRIILGKGKLCKLWFLPDLTSDLSLILGWSWQIYNKVIPTSCFTAWSCMILSNSRGNHLCLS